MKPHISVVVTLYNYSRYIAEAIRSFQKQSCFAQGIDAEMVIVDDASSDNPVAVIEQYKDERLKYCHLETNGGYSHAKNVGIKMAQAPVLVMLDADDMLTKESLLLRYRKLQEGYDLVHGPALDYQGGAIKNLPVSPLWKKWLADQTSYRNVHAQTVMLRKDVHRRVGLYDVALRSKSDREMWARVFNHGFRIGWVTEPVAVYRHHPNQMHKSKEKLRINDRLQQEVVEKIERRAKDLSDVELLED
jgi:glycosyltransferase involved in cell wall biosynthesis